MPGTKDVLLCPQCDSPLQGELLHGQAIDRCPACDCLWLDFSELAPLVRSTEVSKTLPSNPSLADRPLDCPRCQTTMAVVEYAGDSKVFIRKCTTCGGTWLNAGQLVALARYRQGTGDTERVAWAGTLAPFAQPEPAPQLREDAFDDPQKAKQWITVRQFWQSPVLVIGVVTTYFSFMLATGGPARAFALWRFFGFVAIVILACNPIRMAKGVRSVEKPIDAFTPEDLLTVVAWVVMLGVMAFQIWLRLEGKI